MSHRLDVMKTSAVHKSAPPSPSTYKLKHITYTLFTPSDLLPSSLFLTHWVKLMVKGPVFTASHSSRPDYAMTSFSAVKIPLFADLPLFIFSATFSASPCLFLSPSLPATPPPFHLAQLQTMATLAGSKTTLEEKIIGWERKERKGDRYNLIKTN